MSTGNKEPHPNPSLEERIKSNVAPWFPGAVATGFAAGIAAVKWSDERYKVEPIPHRVTAIVPTATTSCR
jgi:hypothetical protein